jgi:exodeoxyribonuclease VII large subunit
MVKLASPQAILNRGFAIIIIDGKVVTDPQQIGENAQIQTLLRDEVIYSTVTQKVKDEKRADL